MSAALADISAVSEAADHAEPAAPRRDDLHVYALARSSSGELLMGHVSHSSHSSHSSGGGHYSHASHASHSSHSSHVSGGPSHISSGPTPTPTPNPGPVHHPNPVAGSAQGQPDLRISTPGGALHGNDIYGSLKPQTIKQAGAAGTTLRWKVSVQNDAAVSDQVRVRGARSAHGFTVTYLDATGKDVTSQVEAGSFRTPRLARGAAYALTVVVAVGDDASPSRALTGKVAGYSVASPGRTDAVEFVATRS